MAREGADGSRSGTASTAAGNGTGTGTGSGSGAARRTSDAPPATLGSGGPGGIPGLTGTGSSAVQGLGFGLPAGGSTPGGPPPGGGLTMAGPSGLAGQGVTPGGSETRIDLVVDCGPEGVTVQPGGYRLSRQALESGDLLVRRLEAVAALERARKPGETTKPCLHFHVRPGAEETFWKARQQTTFAGLDWPATLRVAEGAGSKSGSFTGRLR